jgi:hypothetical protein
MKTQFVLEDTETKQHIATGANLGELLINLAELVKEQQKYINDINARWLKRNTIHPDLSAVALEHQVGYCAGFKAGRDTAFKAIYEGDGE